MALIINRNIFQIHGTIFVFPFRNGCAAPFLLVAWDESPASIYSGTCTDADSISRTPFLVITRASSILLTQINFPNSLQHRVGTRIMLFDLSTVKEKPFVVVLHLLRGVRRGGRHDEGA